MESQVNTPPLLVIVVPCFNEGGVITETIPQILSLMCQETGVSNIADKSFILLVDDGSTDDTWANILKLTQENCGKVRGLKLVTNFGHQNAIMAGMEHIAESIDACITIDADLQDDISVIPRMVEEFKRGAKVVLGVRRERRSDSLFKRLTAHLHYWLSNLLGIRATANHADFRLLSKESVRHLLLFKESSLYIRALVHLIDQNPAFVYYKRLERKRGVSKYNFRRMITLSLRGITSHSVAPLRFCTVLGIATSILSLVMLVYALSGWLLGLAVPGWLSIVAPLYLLGGATLFCLGIIGEYVGNIFVEAKARPRYIIEKAVGNE